MSLYQLIQPIQITYPDFLTELGVSFLWNNCNTNDSSGRKLDQHKVGNPETSPQQVNVVNPKNFWRLAPDPIRTSIYSMLDINSRYMSIMFPNQCPWMLCSKYQYIASLQPHNFHSWKIPVWKITICESLEMKSRWWSAVLQCMVVPIFLKSKQSSALTPYVVINV